MDNIVGLLPSQHSIIYHTMLNEEFSEVYVVQHIIRFTEEVDLRILQNACEYIVNRNDILRGVIIIDNNSELRLLIKENVDFVVEYINTTIDPDVAKLMISEIVGRDRKKGFDIFQSPLFRFKLIQYNNYYYFIWTFHHILLGGDSMVIMKELLELYYALKNNNTIKFSTLEKYYNFLPNILNKEASSSKKYWKKLLEGYTNDTSFSSNLNITKDKYFKQQFKKFELDQKKTANIHNVLANKKIKLNIFLQTAWSILLSKYFCKNDLVFGVVRAFPSKITQTCRGPFYNTFPVRINLTNNTRLMDLVIALDCQNQKMKEYYYSTASNINSSRVPNKSNQLFNTIFEYKTHSFETYFKKCDFFTNQEFSFIVDTDVALCLEIYDDNITIAGRLHYDSRLMDDSYSENIVEHFLFLLEELIEDVDKPLKDISMLTSYEKVYIGKILTSSIDKKCKIKDSLIGDFRKIVLHNPNKLLLASEYQITYKLVYEKVILIANNIDFYTNGQSAPIIIFIEEKQYQIMSILATLYVGSYYVPVNTNWPLARIQNIVKLCKKGIFLFDNSLSSKLKIFLNQQGYNIINVEKILKKNIFPLNSNMKLNYKNNNPNDLAYIIFTSGTTGSPKGVKITHTNAMNTIVCINNSYNVTANDAILALSDITFDLAVFDIFGMLNKGATLVLPEVSEVNNPQSWIMLMIKHKVTIWNSVPAYMRMLLSYLTIENTTVIKMLKLQLKLIMLSGDKIDVSLIQQLKKIFTQTKIICLGGATEASIWSIAYDAKNFSPELKLVPYGLPLSGQSVYILDENKNFCGFNIPGEICIGGKGVSQGYITENNSDNDNFIFHSGCNQQIYLTGDLGYLSIDGNIVITGRKDFQVKLNGYRIEPNEIENIINQLNGVTSIVVVHNKNILVAYYTDTTSGYPQEIMKQKCKEYLPEYMIPNVFVRLNTFPLTFNGKINRKKLPVPCFYEKEDINFNALDDTSLKLRNIYLSVLNISYIGITENFFSYRIDSIQFIEILVKINRTFNINISLKDILACSTLAEVANYIKKQLISRSDTLSTSNINYLINGLRESIWYISQSKNHLSSYNIPILLHALGSFSLDKLKESLFNVLRNHEIFGSYFIYHNGNLNCYYDERYLEKIHFSVVNVENIDTKNLMSLLKKSANLSFDLSKSPLIRIEIFIKNSNELFVLVCVHHIIFDKKSENIFISELIDFYIGRRNFRSDMKSFTGMHQFNYDVSTLYLEKIKEKTPAIIPYDKFIENKKLANAGYISNQFTIDREKLDELMGKSDVTEFMFLVSVIQLLFAKITRNNEPIIGIPISCRHITNDAIGLLTNTLPVYCSVNEKLNLLEFLQENKKNILDAMSYQYIPYIELVRKIKPERMGSNPLFNILFVYNESCTESFQMVDGTIKKSNIELDFTKFDLTVFVEKNFFNYRINVEYNKNLYLESTVSKIIDYFISLISFCIKNYKFKIKDIFKLLTKKFSKNYLIGQECPDYLTSSIVQQFNNITKLYADNIALKFNDDLFTYKEIDILSDKIATKIQKYCLGANNVIATMVERNAMAVIIILAILKTKNIYMPLDIKLPKERIFYILNDSNAKLVILDNKNISFIKKFLKEYRLSISYFIGENDLNSDGSCFYEKNLIEPSSPAYILYTSGTTGNPKKICLPHKTIVNLVLWQKKSTTDDAQIIAQFNSLIFDVSLQEIFYALLTGAKLVIINETLKNNFFGLVNFVKNEGVNKFFIPTPLFDLFATHVNLNSIIFENLNEIIVAGDKLVLTNNIRKMFHLQPKNIYLSNHYGPSETHVVTCYKMNVKNVINLGIPSIGKPISNIKIILQDEHGEEALPGLPAELCIKSDVITLLNHEKDFIFKTGDLVKLDDDENLHFLERIDSQIKIAGYRINLGEISQVLFKNELVSDCYVTSIKSENTKIHAFIILKTNLKISESRIKIEQNLRENLPSYMIPLLHICEFIPHFSNGKVDVLFLINKFTQKPPAKKYNNFILDELHKLFFSLIGNSDFDENKNFFQLGGDSFQALQLICLLENSFGCKLSSDEFIKHSSIQYLYDYITSSIEKQKKLSEPSIVTKLKEGKNKELLIFIPPIDGTLFCFRSLVNCFFDDKTIIGLQDPYWFGIENIDSIEMLANLYMHEILKNYSDYESYFICGSSFGSIVAVELAFLLKERNKIISWLGILDGWVIIPKFIHEKYIFSLMAHYDFEKSKSELNSLPANDLNKYLALRRDRLSQLQGHQIRVPDCPLHLFKATESDLIFSDEAVKYNGWNTVTSNKIFIYNIPGNHDSMFFEPNVYFLANKIIISFNHE